MIPQIQLGQEFLSRIYGQTNHKSCIASVQNN